jgi:hypothetical protein
VREEGRAASGGRVKRLPESGRAQGAGLEQDQRIPEATHDAALTTLHTRD